MSEQAKELDLSMWFSTYGILTSERILARFGIQLKHKELIQAIKTPQSLYYQLLRIPLKNVFNGIILDQANEYQVYAQKIFIDFLLSGHNDKEENSPGADTRDAIEAQRLSLIELGENFSQIELAHKRLIAESQSSSIKLAADLQQILGLATKRITTLLQKINVIKTSDNVLLAIREGIAQDDNIKDGSSVFWIKMAEILNVEISLELQASIIKELTDLMDFRIKMQVALAPYLERASDISIRLRQFRSEFYQIIIRTTELLGLLSDYRPDPLKQADNRALLDFDPNIGEH